MKIRAFLTINKYFKVEHIYLESTSNALTALNILPRRHDFITLGPIDARKIDKKKAFLDIPVYKVIIDPTFNVMKIYLTNKAIY